MDPTSSKITHVTPLAVQHDVAQLKAAPTKVTSVFFSAIKKPEDTPKPPVFAWAIDTVTDTATLDSLMLRPGLVAPTVEGATLQDRTVNSFMYLACNGLDFLKTTSSHLKGYFSILSDKSLKVSDRLQKAYEQTSSDGVRAYYRTFSLMMGRVATSVGTVGVFAKTFGESIMSSGVLDLMKNLATSFTTAFYTIGFIQKGVDIYRMQVTAEKIYETSTLSKITNVFKKALSYIKLTEAPSLEGRVSNQKMLENIDKHFWSASDEEAFKVCKKEDLEAYLDKNLSKEMEAVLLRLSGSTQSSIDSKKLLEALDDPALVETFRKYANEKLKISDPTLTGKQLVALCIIKSELIQKKQEAFLNQICEGSQDKVKLRSMIDTTLKMRQAAQTQMGMQDAKLIQESEMLLMKEIGAQMNRKNWQHCAMFVFFAVMTAVSIAVLVHPPSLLAVTAIFLAANFISWAISARGLAVASEHEAKLQSSFTDKLIDANPVYSGIQNALSKMKTKLPQDKKFWIMALVNTLTIAAITASLVLDPVNSVQFLATLISISVMSLIQFGLQSQGVRELIADTAKVVDDHVTKKVLSLTGETTYAKDTKAFDESIKDQISIKLNNLTSKELLELCEILSIDLEDLEFYVRKAPEEKPEVYDFEKAIQEYEKNPAIEKAFCGAIRTRLQLFSDTHRQEVLDALVLLKK